MLIKTKNKIIQYINSQNDGMISTGGFIKAGFHNKYINELIENDILFKIKNGLYINKDKVTNTGFYEVQKAISGSIICLGSAISYYNLTNYEPPYIWIAVKRGRKVHLPKYPKVKVFHFSNKQYETGIISEKIEGNNINIYNIEKTICDIIRYRNKIGIDITNEVVKNYLNRDENNLQKITKYAKQLRIYNPVFNYLRILS